MVKVCFEFLNYNSILIVLITNGGSVGKRTKIFVLTGGRADIVHIIPGVNHIENRWSPVIVVGYSTVRGFAPTLAIILAGDFFVIGAHRFALQTKLQSSK